MLSTITSNIKARVQVTLGSGYSELGYAYDLSKNSFKGSYAKFSLTPQDGLEVSGATSFITIGQTFELTLVDAFINKPLSDSSQQEKVLELQELALTIYKDLIKTKAGTPASVILVSNFQASTPQFLESAVIQKATFQVRFRTQV
jgi:hypothetical protein